MFGERAHKVSIDGVQVAKAEKAASGFLGSLKEALLAAGRDEMPSAPVRDVVPVAAVALTPVSDRPVVAATLPIVSSLALNEVSPSAEEVARRARRPAAGDGPSDVRLEMDDAVPTTRVLRDARKATAVPARTQLVRGRKAIERSTFAHDPVVGFLVVVGGPGLGSFRPIFEGNNTLGRSAQNRVALDFGDDTISSEAQAYIRYDSNDRSFLFVPNLAKTNVVSVNDKKPTGAVELKPMDVITLGRTQVAFVAFCGSEFDWSEISET